MDTELIDPCPLHADYSAEDCTACQNAGRQPSRASLAARVRDLERDCATLRAALALIAELTGQYFRLHLSGETTMAAIDKAARAALEKVQS